jgi:hypothetical protein
MLEVCRDAATAGEEQLISFATEQRKYCLIFTGAILHLRRYTLGELGLLEVPSRRR